MKNSYDRQTAIDRYNSMTDGTVDKAVAAATIASQYDGGRGSYALSAVEHATLAGVNPFDGKGNFSAADFAKSQSSK
jgi:hypothetical protein